MPDVATRAVEVQAVTAVYCRACVSSARTVMLDVKPCHHYDSEYTLSRIHDYADYSDWCVHDIMCCLVFVLWLSCCNLDE